MTLNEYQELSMRTKLNNDLKENLLCGGLGISGEAGEVSDTIKKIIFHGHEFNKNELIKELGDVLWYISFISNSIDCTLEDVAKQNIDKLNKRYPNGFSKENSINRE